MEAWDHPTAVEDCHECEPPQRTRHTKLLRATPETVHWGYLDATIKPALTIDSGERVTIECASCNPEWMPAKDSGFEILPDIVEIHQKVKKGIRQSYLHRPDLCAWRRGREMCSR